MTVLVLYAAVPADRLPLPAAAIPSGLEVLRGESVGVLFEERDARPNGEVEDVVAFGERLQQIAASCTVLPVRYGTVLPDRDELTALVSEHEERWNERLAVVDGHGEVLVHVSDTDAPAPSPTAGAGSSGREYLMARAAVVRHREELVSTLLSAVRPLCREVRLLSRGDGQRDEHRVACLIRPDDLAALTEALEGWAAKAPGRKVRTTGPWPPFSFAEEEQ